MRFYYSGQICYRKILHFRFSTICFIAAKNGQAKGFSEGAVYATRAKNQVLYTQNGKNNKVNAC